MGQSTLKPLSESKQTMEILPQSEPFFEKLKGAAPSIAAAQSEKDIKPMTTYNDWAAL